MGLGSGGMGAAVAHGGAGPPVPHFAVLSFLLLVSPGEAGCNARQLPASPPPVMALTVRWLRQTKCSQALADVPLAPLFLSFFLTC